jgi:hypothetical protein
VYTVTDIPSVVALGCMLTGGEKKFDDPGRAVEAKMKTVGVAVGIAGEPKAGRVDGPEDDTAGYKLDKLCGAGLSMSTSKSFRACCCSDAWGADGEETEGAGVEGRVGRGVYEKSQSAYEV